MKIVVGEYFQVSIRRTQQERTRQKPWEHMRSAQDQPIAFNTETVSDLLSIGTIMIGMTMM